MDVNTSAFSSGASSSPSSSSFSLFSGHLSPQILRLIDTDDSLPFVLFGLRIPSALCKSTSTTPTVLSFTIPHLVFTLVEAGILSSVPDSNLNIRSFISNEIRTDKTIGNSESSSNCSSSSSDGGRRKLKPSGVSSKELNDEIVPVFIHRSFLISSNFASSSSSSSTPTTSLIDSQDYGTSTPYLSRLLTHCQESLTKFLLPTTCAPNISSTSSASSSSSFTKSNESRLRSSIEQINFCPLSRQSSAHSSSTGAELEADDVKYLSQQLFRHSLAAFVNYSLLSQGYSQIGSQWIRGAEMGAGTEVKEEVRSSSNMRIKTSIASKTLRLASSSVDVQFDNAPNDQSNSMGDSHLSILFALRSSLLTLPFISAFTSFDDESDSICFVLPKSSPFVMISPPSTKLCTSTSHLVPSFPLRSYWFYNYLYRLPPAFNEVECRYQGSNDGDVKLIYPTTACLQAPVGAIDRHQIKQRSHRKSCVEIEVEIIRTIAEKCRVQVRSSKQFTPAGSSLSSSSSPSSSFDFELVPLFGEMRARVGSKSSSIAKFEGETSKPQCSFSTAAECLLSSNLSCTRELSFRTASSISSTDKSEADSDFNESSASQNNWIPLESFEAQMRTGLEAEPVFTMPAGIEEEESTASTSIILKPLSQETKSAVRTPTIQLSASSKLKRNITKCDENKKQSSSTGTNRSGAKRKNEANESKPVKKKSSKQSEKRK